MKDEGKTIKNGRLKVEEHACHPSALRLHPCLRLPPILRHVTMLCLCSARNFYSLNMME
jgi:hypothetical protein